MNGTTLWPRYSSPDDIVDIERTPLSERGLPASTYELLCRAARLWPDRTAVAVLRNAERWQEPATLTFAELLANVNRMANLLRQIGVGRQDTVALLSPNCQELISATLAAQAAGIAVPINPGLSEDHIAELLQRSGARVLVAAGPDLDPVVTEAAFSLAKKGLVDYVLLMSPTGQAPAGPASTVGFASVDYLTRRAATASSEQFHGDRPGQGDVAALFHTGGTTGTPKLAAHTQANEVADAWMLAANDLPGEDAVYFAALPLFHVNALVVTVLAPLFKGQSVVWSGPLGYRDPALYGVFWKLVEHHRLTAMSAVPTVYATLAASPVNADISSLRHAMVGASPLPAAVRAGFETATGVTLIEGYGLTEATCVSVRSFPGATMSSLGCRLPYQEIKSVHVDDDGHWHDLGPGTRGQLVIKGPTVFPGYVIGNGPDGLLLDGLGKLRDGWLDTGDLGQVDEDGFVQLTGRAKDLIIRGGHNIDPALVEDALLTHPDVTGAAAVGRPDRHAGEVPVAYVTLAAGATTRTEDLLRWADDRVGERASSPKSVTIVNQLPVTAVGKLYKLALRADATRVALSEALRETAAVHAVETDIEDGTIVVTVRADEASHAAVKRTLDEYGVRWRITHRPAGKANR
ncbi:Long-chain-fatty-acid--CoA ligase [Arthrobacter sp. Bi26]|uniref:acyl-CoA synthetase n=1 Tax=Arthrobacter sp. Bi26 TaxID=2822350 RepID=UPI001DDEC83B|nr:acyl-CoA synthetase [Arthrobacter sp. Bi26]CAH0301329.1 Long-chain-fatty-acid--CoA ligase [Arthrobacter sp. Bi26]